MTAAMIHRTIGTDTMLQRNPAWLIASAAAATWFAVAMLEAPAAPAHACDTAATAAAAHGASPHGIAVRCVATRPANPPGGPPGS